MNGLTSFSSKREQKSTVSQHGQSVCGCYTVGISTECNSCVFVSVCVVQVFTFGERGKDVF